MSGTPFQRTYENSKFTQLLTAHWWRRELKGQAEVVAVSPGLIPDTALMQNAMERMNMKFPESALKDANSIPEGKTADVLLGVLSLKWEADLLGDRRTVDTRGVHEAGSPAG